MTTAESKEALARAVDELPAEKVVELVEFAKSLCARNASQPARKPRVLGAYEGKIKILPEFYDPLPDDILDAFEGKSSRICFWIPARFYGHRPTGRGYPYWPVTCWPRLKITCF